MRPRDLTSTEWSALADLAARVAQARAENAPERVQFERELAARTPGDRRPVHTALQAARLAADSLRPEIPQSHRGRLGTLVTLAKRAAVHSVWPFHREWMEAQSRFNSAAISAIDLLWQKKEPPAFTVEPAAPSSLPDRLYRRFALPLLQRQARWNAGAEAALRAAAADKLRPEGERQNRIAALMTQAEEVTPHASLRLRVTAPLWNELFRMQREFNRQFTLALGEFLGVRMPPSAPPPLDYARWIRTAERLPQLPSSPLRVGVLPVGFDPAAPRSRAFVQSVRAQTHRNLAMIPASPSPAALDLSSFDAVLVVGPECVLRPECVALLAAGAVDADVVYADEDRLANGVRCEPFFKPDWSPDLLDTFNYPGRCVLIRGGFEAPSLHGDPDAAIHGALLAATRRGARFRHLPAVLFHRTDTQPVDATNDVGAQVLSAAYPNADIEKTRMGYRVRRPVAQTPLVSVIVPFRDRADLLERLCETLLAKTSWPRFELLLVSNQSVEPATHALLARLVDPRIRHLSFDEPFNYSRINNFAAEQARGTLLLFLNNDMEVVDPGWMTELVGHAVRPEVGSVGAKLLFPDGGLQHAGAVVGLSGFAGHPLWHLTDEGHFTPWGRADWTRDLLAVTAACLMMKRDTFIEVGRFDERFGVVGGDIELGLRLHARGLRNIYTPHARLIHHESASRREERVPVNDLWTSFLAYRRYLRAGDPFYNSNLTLLRPDATLRWRDDDSAEALAVRTLAATLEGR